MHTVKSFHQVEYAKSQFGLVAVDIQYQELYNLKLSADRLNANVCTFRNCDFSQVAMDSSVFFRSFFYNCTFPEDVCGVKITKCYFQDCKNIKGIEKAAANGWDNLFANSFLT